jgi:hypothetical protein
MEDGLLAVQQRVAVLEEKAGIPPGKGASS